MEYKMTKIEIITRKEKLEEFKEAMNSIGVTGMTVSKVIGCGLQKGDIQYYRGVPVEERLIPKIKIEIVVCEVPVDKVISTAESILRTGEIGDGKIFIYDVKDAVKIRTGDRGPNAILDKKI